MYTFLYNGRTLFSRFLFSFAMRDVQLGPAGPGDADQRTEHQGGARQDTLEISPPIRRPGGIHV